MTAIGEHLMEMAELTAIVPAKTVEEARNSMDIDSVSTIRFDRRGRLEAGIKPAPPSTEQPA